MREITRVISEAVVVKTLFRFCAVALLATVMAQGASTINPSNRFAYGANIGWIDGRGDTNNGAVVGEFVCSGFIYSANAGWINLGDGTPTNGIQYRNNGANDFGVNHDGQGNLSGFAWGANIGWLNFTNSDETGASFTGPKVDLLTGRLQGFVWSANRGWISLSNAFAFVQTDSIAPGADSDGDGIADAWELQRTNSLSGFSAATDRDGDGVSDLEEYPADTNPLDANSQLRITAFSASTKGMNLTVTWTSRPTRVYRILQDDALNSGPSWIDSGPGLISPAPTATSTRFLTQTPALDRFFRVQALRPLSP